jgi:pimeloyl-ACP methyl ester carboxylesterase
MLPATRALFEAFIANLQGPDAIAVRRAYVEDMFLPTDDAEQRQRIVETMCSAPLPGALAVLRGVLDWNGVGAMKLCNAPLLVLLSGTGGSNDPPRLRALKANVEIGVTVGAGHFIQLDAPEQVNPMIEAFLKTLAYEKKEPLALSGS